MPIMQLSVAPIVQYDLSCMDYSRFNLWLISSTFQGSMNHVNETGLKLFETLDTNILYDCKIVDCSFNYFSPCEIP